jgi:hypothetical protein
MKKSTDEAPAWAKGYDLTFLREIAGVFKADMKQHTHGAFGLPKEQAAAEALSTNSLVWTKGGGPDIRAVAIAKKLKRPSKHEDFCGRVATIRPGDLVVKAIAGEPEGMAKILHGLIERAEPAAVWIEGHVESKSIYDLVTAGGFTKVITKVSASSDIKGMWLKLRRGGWDGRCPAAELSAADEAGAVIIAPDFLKAVDQRAIMAEAEAAALWAQHYSGYNKGKTWTAFALHGFDAGDPSFIIKPGEMSKKWKAENAGKLTAECGPTAIAEKFPAALAAEKRIPGQKERIRFMRLAPKKGELTRHADITDPMAGTRDGQLCRIHIPLVSDPVCQFHCWDLEGDERIIHFPERAICYLDTRKPHAVTNPAAIERVHLVVDTFSSPELRAMIEAAHG